MDQLGWKYTQARQQMALRMIRSVSSLNCNFYNSDHGLDHGRAIMYYKKKIKKGEK